MTTRRSLLAMMTGAVAILARPGAAGASSGRRLARFARRFEGERYVWAGNTPAGGFDCSGLTMYAVRRTLGLEITQSVRQQWGFGRRVKDGVWEPGDLVFFRNTNGPGLTHVGIFLGDDAFIHAENEETGVVVTDIRSEYYRSHYAGAKRLV